jgi:dissimilatory sulfite reductase (desulfoviridin) alpha/beta subunit
VDWTPKAQAELSRVPFFVRKKVRARVEAEARGAGAIRVEPVHLHSCQQRYLSNLSKEVQGYRVEQCFGPSGCPNRIVHSNDLIADLEKLLREKNISGFLRERLGAENVKPHHEFRVTVAECPNACSHPQIVDVGLVGARMPRIDSESCNLCGRCADVCREDAIEVKENGPVLTTGSCLMCGQCIAACPTGSLTEETAGYRIQLGGRLGRHPRLAREVTGIFSEKAVYVIVEKCIRIFLEQEGHIQRFGSVLDDYGFERLIQELDL